MCYFTAESLKYVFKFSYEHRIYLYQGTDTKLEFSIVTKTLAFKQMPSHFMGNWVTHRDCCEVGNLQ